MSSKSKVSSRGQEALAPGADAARQVLFACIQEQAVPLLNAIRSYVLRSGLATGAKVQAVAAEILQETVVEALAHADAYSTARPPLAWLLGIALNMIKRRRVAQAKQFRRELPLSNLMARRTELESESDFWEQLLSPGENRLELEVEMRSQVASLLGLVSREDQQIIYLALLEDFKREGLAQRLGIAPNAARMRLRRALDRLRAALENHSFKGGTYEI